MAMVQYDSKDDGGHKFWTARYAIRIDANRLGVYRWLITKQGRSVRNGLEDIPERSPWRCLERRLKQVTEQTRSAAEEGAAVHLEQLAGDVAGVVGGEEHHRPGDVGRCAGAAN
jgi:hypothetical protein